MLKKTIKFASIGLAAFILASCSGNSDKSSTTDGDITIQFMTSSVEQERLDTIEGLIEKFEAENKGVTVEVVPVEEDSYNTNIVTLAQAGEMPAVIETGQEYAKTLASEQLIDLEATTKVLKEIGEENYYKGALSLIRSEDGDEFLGVPLSGWVQGIWYSKSIFANADLKEPTNWDELLKAAEVLTDSANKKYGIALPTVEGTFSEQSFSQFALSNDANILTADGKLNIDNPEFKDALTYYQKLSEYTMPGSNDTTEVKDAFSNGTAAMAVYSTYILPSVFENGDPSDIGFIIPTEKSEAVYGSVTALTISAGLEEGEKNAAEKFIAFLSQPENMTEWVLMSPGGGQPVSDVVIENETYQNNEVVQSFGELSIEIAEAFNSVQAFGLVKDKNYTIMGEITGTNALGTMVNQVTVGDMNVEDALSGARETLEPLF